VVDGTEVVGIITPLDIVRAVHEKLI
jgi:predicted transcriptional regulator